LHAPQLANLVPSSRNPSVTKTRCSLLKQTCFVTNQARPSSRISIAPSEINIALSRSNISVEKQHLSGAIRSRSGVRSKTNLKNIIGRIGHQCEWKSKTAHRLIIRTLFSAIDGRRRAQPSDRAFGSVRAIRPARRRSVSEKNGSKLLRDDKFLQLDKSAAVVCPIHRRDFADGAVSRIDRDDVRRLYEQHGRGLLAYACSFTPSFATAEDVLHQVFERLLRGDIEIHGEPAPYLYRAVRNASLNQIRNRTREVDLEDGWFDSPPGMELTGLELQSALHELPEEQREVILLHVWAQMSFDETGDALGISPNTAASRYRYGLAKLREQFQTTARGKYGRSK